MSTEVLLVHLHLDFEQYLAEVLRKWNTVQNAIEFVGVRPSRRLEQPLLTPGAISDDEASIIAARIRTDAGFSRNGGIIVFSEKRLFDDTYWQLFVGGREADDDPPRVAVLSLQFLRHTYEETGGRGSGFLSAIVSNILFSIGVDAGLEDHGSETHGCIMDFCEFMPAIGVGLAQGVRFCQQCTRILRATPSVGHAILALPEAFAGISDVEAAERDVTQAIRLRGQRYSADTDGFDYDVALSFSGSDRDYAERLAGALRSSDVTVFYDRSEQAYLWGENLQTHLAELYRVRARYCILLVSESYALGRWPRVELEAALAREFESGDTYILPVRMDDTQLKGLLPTRATVDARQESIDDIVAMVKCRLGAPSPQGHLARWRHV